MNWLNIEAKYKRYNINDNKRGCKIQNANNKRGYKVQNAKCKVQNTKCEIGVAITTANVNEMPFYIYLPPSLYLFSLSL